jgi:hypothetical protein
VKLDQDLRYLSPARREHPIGWDDKSARDEHAASLRNGLQNY